MEESIAKKNIAVSLSRMPLPKDGAGDFVYAQSLLDNLFKIDRINKYYLLLNWKTRKYFKERYKGYKNVEFKNIGILGKLIARIKKDDSFKEKQFKKALQKFTNKKSINTLFFPLMIIYPKGIKNVKIVSTIYDLQHEYFPKNFSEKNLQYRKENYQYTALYSDQIIALSDFTKKSIVEKYKVNPDKITVIYLAGNDGKNETKPIPLPENFLFYPAAIWPHKNHKILIEALNRLKNNFPDLNLVFTGAVRNQKAKEEIDDLIRFYKLSKKVIFLGRVSDEIMNYVYHKAKILVFPSSFEGFGLPLVEAFEHGLPVVAANNTSISEVVGEAGLLFETNNPEMLVGSIKKVLSNRDLREQLIKRGLERAKKFTWEDTARKTLSILENV